MRRDPVSKAHYVQVISHDGEFTLTDALKEVHKDAGEQADKLGLRALTEQEKVATEQFQRMRAAFSQ